LLILLDAYISGFPALPNPTLNCIYLTPKEDTILQVPCQSVYHYNDHAIFTNNIDSAVDAKTTLPSVNSQVVNCGSVMVIDSALDLGISPSDTSGADGRFIFQVQNSNFVNDTDQKIRCYYFICCWY
jgi:hypothetical protein